MRVNKNRFTFHGYTRAKERLPFNDNELKSINLYAKKNGLNLNDLEVGSPLYNYLRAKESYRNKTVKLYRGYVFVFCRNSKRVITCYPIKEDYLEEYNEAMEKKKNAGN